MVGSRHDSARRWLPASRRSFGPEFVRGPPQFYGTVSNEGCVLANAAMETQPDQRPVSLWLHDIVPSGRRAQQCGRRTNTGRNYTKQDRETQLFGSKHCAIMDTDNVPISGAST